MDVYVQLGRQNAGICWLPPTNKMKYKDGVNVADGKTNEKRLLGVSRLLDPAVMASPFITTIVDAISLLAYFLIAQALLHI